jgi:hypothetical protein
VVFASTVSFSSASLTTVGLLLNFGGETMKEGVKRVVNNYTASSPSLLRINQVR